MPGLLDGFVSNPMLNMGAGLLSVAGPSLRPRSFGGGLSLGLENMRRGQQSLMQTRLAQAQMAKMQAEGDARRKMQAQMTAGTQGAEQVIGLLSDPRQKAVVQGLLSAGEPVKAIETAQAFLGLGQQGERRIVKGPDGRNYYADTQQPVLPDVQAPPAAAPQRRIVKDAAGTQRYPDTGEVVFPGVTPPEDQAAKPKLNEITAIRKEYQAQSGKWVATRDAYESVKSSMASGAGDIAMVISFMKALDPGSVVREGEFATAADSAGLGGKIRSYFAKLDTGERLTVEQRADFAAQAKAIMMAQGAQQIRREREYQGIAQRLGLNEKDVVRDLLGEYRGSFGGSGGLLSSAPASSAAVKTGRFSGIPADQMIATDVDALSDAEVDAYNARMDELGL